MTEDNKVRAEILSRLKNIKGHIAGIERMVEEEQPCENIMIQISAVRAAIEKVGIYYLENNAVQCLVGMEYEIEEKAKVAAVVKQLITFLK